MLRCTALLALALAGLWSAPAPALRVVALAPHLAELACAAGGCDQLVGVVAHSDHPAELRTRPVVGDAFNLNAEAVLALRPDLVLSWRGGTPAAVEAQLARLGLNLWPIKVETLADIGAALRALGARLGTAQAAAQAAAAFEARIDTLRRRYAGKAPLRVFYQIEAGPIFTVNARSPISEAIAVCGGVNVFAELPRLAGAVGVESVLAARPDVVVWGRQENSAAIRAFWARWPSIPAVRSGQLYEIDADLLVRATPRMADGIDALCAALDRARDEVLRQRGR